MSRSLNDLFLALATVLTLASLQISVQSRETRTFCWPVGRQLVGNQTFNESNNFFFTWCTPRPTPPPTPPPTLPPITTTQTPIPKPSADSIAFMALYGPLQNGYRSRHGANSLTQDDALSELARVCAKNYATQNPTPPADPQACGQSGEIHDYGERKPGMVETANEVMDYWYTREIQRMNWANLGPNVDTQHFTQIVWKASSKYGCAIEFNAPKTRYFVSCVYRVAGNNGENGGYTGNVQQ